MWYLSILYMCRRYPPTKWERYCRRRSRTERFRLPCIGLDMRTVVWTNRAHLLFKERNRILNHYIAYEVSLWELSLYPTDQKTRTLLSLRLCFEEKRGGKHANANYSGPAMVTRRRGRHTFPGGCLGRVMQIFVRRALSSGCVFQEQC